MSLTDYFTSARKTDQFIGFPNHSAILAAGLFGEAGSILAELKKSLREREAYPAYRRRLVEEIGDFLWYFVRLADVTRNQQICLQPKCNQITRGCENSLSTFLKFGNSVGDLLSAINENKPANEVTEKLQHIWDALLTIANDANVSIEEAALENIRKVESRWPTIRAPIPLFDDKYPEEEQLPRNLVIEFREKARGDKKIVLLRCNDLNFGDQITDNIEDPDGYRYHDVFHFSNAVFLGWSPVLRSLLRCKRKSDSKVDESQDGARAAILEEAIAASLFSRAKKLQFFKDLTHLDYDILKMIQEVTSGFEVEQVPLWQWEQAILEGYNVFRLLRSNSGGRVALDLINHKLTYSPPQQ